VGKFSLFGEEKRKNQNPSYSKLFQKLIIQYIFLLLATKAKIKSNNNTTTNGSRKWEAGGRKLKVGSRRCEIRLENKFIFQHSAECWNVLFGAVFI